MQLSKITWVLALTALLYTLPATAATLTPQMEKAFQAQPLQRVIISLKNDSMPKVKKKNVSPKAKHQLYLNLKEEYAAQKQALLNDLADQKQQLKILHEYDALPLMSALMTREQALLLLDNPQVKTIELDQLSKPAMEKATDFIGATQLLQADKNAGQGTGIVVMDISARYWDNKLFPGCSSLTKGNFKQDTANCPIKVWKNFATTTGTSTSTKLTDEQVYQVAEADHHGTLVTSTVNILAPKADIVFLNVFHMNEKEELLSWQSDQIAALNWVYNGVQEGGELAKYHIMAINMSLSGIRSGTPSTACDNDSIQSPIWALYLNNDVVTFIAAGNDHFANSVGMPGCISSAFTIGAQFQDEGSRSSCKVFPGQDNSPTYKQVATKGDLACFSNRNGLIDFVAPGVNIEYPNGDIVSGTSFASPLAAATYLLYQYRNYSYTGKYDFYWAKSILETMAQPIYSFDSYYSQLSLQTQNATKWSLAVPVWDQYGEELDTTGSDNTPPNRIFANTGLTVQTEEIPEDKDISLIGGAYMYLDILANEPEKVMIKITPPNSIGVPYIPISLPATSTANFNGLIGRTVLPGALKSLIGQSPAGRWTIEFSTTSTTDKVYLMEAALFLIAEGCKPSCQENSCGDDLCGGACGLGLCPDDGIFCNGQAHCRYNTCQAGTMTTPECLDSDGLECTNYCNEQSRTCDRNSSANIVSGSCLINKQCYKENDRDPDNSCVSCQPLKNTTAFSVDEYAVACEDGDLCTINDHCNLGKCIAGEQRNCDTDNVCAESIGCLPRSGCQYKYIDAPCDDGDPCTINEYCQDGQCRGGDRLICDDDNICTTDSCDKNSGKCVFENNSLPCSDGNATTVGDTCQAGKCVPGKAKKSGCSASGLDEGGTLPGLFLALLFLLLAGRVTRRRAN